AGGHGCSFRCAASGGVGVGVVEGVECAVRRDRELEPVAETGVLDLDGERVLGRVPEQLDDDSVALAGGELAGLGGHGSSSGHGMSTSLTRVAVVRSATKNGSCPS